MLWTLIIVRYPKYLGVFGFLSMALFRVPLWFDKKITFWKLMGSSATGSFDMRPDLRQWGLLFTSNDPTIPKLIREYLRFFRCDLKKFIMEPTTAHGSWDGKPLIASGVKIIQRIGPVAVLTRATIRVSRLKNFWRHAPLVGKKLNNAKGLLVSYGLGELPFIKQATFSVWEDESSMVAFAYKADEHAQVIRKTRDENWYKEELFVRFRIISVSGFDKRIAAKMLNLPASYEEA